MKTLMSDHVSHADLVVNTLMQDSGGSHQSNLLTELKFWSNSFDNVKFLYDHLNVTELVEKVKTIGAQ